MLKQWNWQHPDWPRFTWTTRAIDSAARQFVEGFEDLNVVLRRAGEEDLHGLRIAWLTNEAIETSAIEGEILDRDSIQASLLRRFGLRPSARRHGAAEEGIAEMMVSLYSDFAQPLDHETLGKWHIMLMSANPYIETIGGYRRHEDPMQVVSGPYGRETIHFEAPPAVRIPSEMDRFVDWFNRKTETTDPAAALEAAAVTHLYFECIHPFEDGNGRIGRALAEKALARMLGRPTLLPLSAQICRQKKGYYAALNQASRTLDLTEWLDWFARIAIQAQAHGKQSLICVLAQARVFDQLQGQVNARQENALLRLFEAEPEGFEGGMSAKNYQSITGASESSATRDLAALVDWGVLRKTGERRHTRYRLVLPDLESLLDSLKAPAPSATVGSEAVKLRI
ncbi:MAG: Fic family protein [Gammaproteobacteria bacterium]|nr:Fic family protein [Gammaproteobacteria bacterium]